MDTKIKCNNGTVVGKETDGLIIWKGIPYATQPVGKLRWQGDRRADHLEGHTLCNSACGGASLEEGASCPG